MQEAVKEETLPGDIIVDAIYSDQMIPDYRDNPLIEALPPIFTEDDVIENISVFPPFNEKERELSPNYRFHCIKRIFQYFQPFEKHLELEIRISSAIRQGYIKRHPLNKQNVQQIHESYRAIKDGRFLKDYKTDVKTKATGFTIIGLSGIGKTTAIERVLAFYPQLIRHHEYKEDPLNLTQISWLKLECPYNGSIKGLCTSFFSELDRLLGTNYLNKYVKPKDTAELMLQRMVHLSSLYKIGLLVIDEIQHLSLRGSGAEEMLNFFVTLVNTIGVPVVLVGTNKATSVLQKEFRQARRGQGEDGDMVWELVSKDNPTWELFIAGLWEYQWTEKFTPLSKELSDLIYDESQGILDIAVKLFAISQVRAISTGQEKINGTIIKEVAKESLKLVQPMLRALKSGIPSEIAKYEDIRSVDMEFELEKYKASVDLQEKIRIQKKLQAQQRNKRKQSLNEEVTLNLLKMGVDAKKIERALKKVIKNLGEDVDKTVALAETFKLVVQDDEKKKETKSVNLKKKGRESQNVLGQFMKEARAHKLSIYEWFLKKDVIKNPLNDFWEGETDVTMVSDTIS